MTVVGYGDVKSSRKPYLDLAVTQASRSNTQFVRGRSHFYWQQCQQCQREKQKDSRGQTTSFRPGESHRAKKL